MGCQARENKNIWWYLFTYTNYGDKKKWRGYKVFTKNWWRNEYVFHDSIGKFFNRYIICKINGHKELKKITICKESSKKISYCFACETYKESNV